MRKTMMVVVLALALVPLMFSISEARRTYLDSVNSTCGTSYGCGACHIDPRGGGPLTPEGQGFQASGYDACYFCSTSPSCSISPTCTDSDGDGFFAEGGTCGTADCNDTNAGINPGACDILKNGIDEDCSGKDRLKGKACP
jgi:hypothetical protein